MTTTSDSFRQIQLWSQYHRALGVELFYIFVDGQVRRALQHAARTCQPL